MSGKVLMRLIAISICLLIPLTGCSETDRTVKTDVKPAVIQTQPKTKVDLAMKFTTGDITMYKIDMKAVKDFKFEQPSLDKSKEEQTGTIYEFQFLQEIESVDNSGNGIAKVTVKDLKYLVKSKDGIDLDFDSRRDSDKKQVLARLIGQHYKIKISPNGKVSVVDAEAIRRVTVDKIARNFLSDERIIKRHEILSLPDTDNSTLQTGQSWNRIKSSPPGLLDPKTFEITYTLKNVNDQQFAIVEMNAVPTSKPAEDAPTKGGSGMGIFAKMFDTEERFNGQLVLDTQTGKVQKYNEELIATYIAAEESRQQKPDKGPDTLTMGFTYSISLEVID